MNVDQLTRPQMVLLRSAILQGKRVMRFGKYIAVFSINHKLLRKVIDEKKIRKERINGASL